jgi:hypothetical protein
MNSNNLLAVELENENDAAAKTLPSALSKNSLRLKRRLKRQPRISQNDPHVKTLGADRNHHIHGSDAGIRKRK